MLEPSEEAWLDGIMRRQECRNRQAVAKAWACVRCRGVMCNEHCLRQRAFWYRVQKVRMGVVNSVLTPWRGPAGRGGKTCAALLRRC